MSGEESPTFKILHQKIVDNRRPGDCFLGELKKSEPNPRSTSMASDDVSRYFPKGADIEISSNDDGFLGSWYPGTVIKPPDGQNKKLWVEYKTLKKKERSSEWLKEELLLMEVRPAPPVEKCLKFEFSENVDAWYHDGWWEGIVTEVNGEDDYTVFFKFTREQRHFQASGLRRHREWVSGKWIPPFADDSPRQEEQVQEIASSPTDEAKLPSSPTNNGSEHDFSPKSDLDTQFTPEPGSSVEVSSDEDGFEGAFFPATVINEVNKTKYLVEYKSLFSDSEGKKLLREEINIDHLRPSPPDIGLIDRFEVHDQVDAFYNDCWWAGVIAKVLKVDRYFVHFKSSDEQFRFEHCNLRVHQDWINGKWFLCGKSQSLGSCSLGQERVNRGRCGSSNPLPI